MSPMNAFVRGLLLNSIDQTECVRRFAASNVYCGDSGQKIAGMT